MTSNEASEEEENEDLSVLHLVVDDGLLLPLKALLVFLSHGNPRLPCSIVEFGPPGTELLHILGGLQAGMRITEFLPLRMEVEFVGLICFNQT